MNLAELSWCKCLCIGVDLYHIIKEYESDFKYMMEDMAKLEKKGNLE